jgi:hypothetical protein
MMKRTVMFYSSEELLDRMLAKSRVANRRPFFCLKFVGFYLYKVKYKKKRPWSRFFTFLAFKFGIALN